MTVNCLRLKVHMLLYVLKKAEVSSDEENEDEDDVPLANLANSSSVSNIKIANRVYQWRKHGTPMADRTFQGTFTEPPEELTPLQYLKLFSKDEILNTIVENTKLYRVQKSGTLVNTTKDEISSFIGIHILMGIAQLPNYKAYWSRELRFPPVADVMPINQYEKLRQYLHFVDNNAPNNDNDKLFKVRPTITAIRDECVKINQKNSKQSMSKLFLVKLRELKSDNIIPKNPKNGDLKI